MLLSIELVPISTWNINLSKLCPPTEWKKLRTTCYESAKKVCEICGGVGTRHAVEAHEIWEFDEINNIQRLSRLIALCPACHEVKHFGRASALGNRKRALEHLKKVNAWNDLEAKKHIKESMEKWIERSSKEWTVDVSLIYAEFNIPESRKHRIVTLYGDCPDNRKEWRLIADNFDWDSSGYSVWEKVNPI